MSRAAFDALHRGPTAVTTFAEARLEVAHWSGRSPLTLDYDDGEVARAIEMTRSWFEDGPDLPDGPPARCSTREQVYAALAPKKREVKITANRLWTKRSY